MTRRKSNAPSVSFFAFQDIITAVVGIFILITLLLVLELAQRVEAAAQTPMADIAAVVEAIEALKQETQRMATEIALRTESADQDAALNEFNRAERTERLENTVAVAQARLKELNEKAKETAGRIATAEKKEITLLMRSEELRDDRSILEQLKAKLAEVENAINRLDGDDTPLFRDKTETGRFVTLITFRAGTIELRDALSRGSIDFTSPRKLDDLRDWLTQNDLGKRQLFLVITPGAAGDFEAIRATLDKQRAVYGFNVSGPASQLKLGFEVTEAP
jgi:hypothetical protein